ncbi:MAG: recombinase family protein [Oscillospiraceae bacterium]|jgi:DNA invertase Pin-like site-specific DNA recombinase|nr:recombinase family protein [Oscillospiraceae bacterium]
MKEYGYFFGYARVSTFEQNLTKQLELFKLLNIADEYIYTDKISGNDFERPGLNELKMEVERGDTVYIYSFTRLGRSAKKLKEEIEWFKKKGIKIISHKENLELTNLGDEAMKIWCAQIELETILLKERLELGRIESEKMGGRPKVRINDIKRVIKMVADGKTVKHSCDIVGISPKTYYNYREIGEN